MIKVFLVTVSYNSEKETHDLLKSLQEVHQKNFSLSTIVVDNASQVPFQLSQSEKKENITLLTTKTNLGFSGGYNLGIKHALDRRADYVVILNNDTLVKSDFIVQFLKTYEEEKNAGIIVPKIYFAKGHEFHKERYKASEKGNVFWYAGGFMDWANVFSKHRGVDQVDKGQYETRDNITFATGCCMFISRQVLERVGLFDEKLYLYFEDADISQRVLKAGYSLLYEPKAVIWHVNASSGGGPGSPLHDYYLTRNRMVFGIRYAPIKSKIALLRESLRLLLYGRQWQKKGIEDFYVRKLGKGSFNI